MNSFPFGITANPFRYHYPGKPSSMRSHLSTVGHILALWSFLWLGNMAFSKIQVVLYNTKRFARLLWNTITLFTSTIISAGSSGEDGRLCISTFDFQFSDSMCSIFLLGSCFNGVRFFGTILRGSLATAVPLLCLSLWFSPIIILMVTRSFIPWFLGNDSPIILVARRKEVVAHRWLVAGSWTKWAFMRSCPRVENIEEVVMNAEVGAVVFSLCNATRQTSSVYDRDTHKLLPMLVPAVALD